MHMVFVCTGNVCRSPMAEGLFRDMVKTRAGFTAASAGIGAADGQSPSAYAVEAMRELGLDISDLRSKMISAKMVADADLILAMTYGQHDTLQLLFPAAADKIFLLRDFETAADDAPAGREVADPIDQSLPVYRRCCEQIRNAIKAMLDQLLDDRAGAPDRVLIAGDASAATLRAALTKELQRHGHIVEDLAVSTEQGAQSPPAQAAAVVAAVNAGRASLAVWVGKSAAAVSARSFPGLRPVTVHDAEEARALREYTDANVVVLPADELNFKQAAAILNSWLGANTDRSRAARRRQAIAALKARINMHPTNPNLEHADPEIYRAISAEKTRQFNNIELIASENFTSRAVMEAQGSCLTNKYAEGYPGRRWYGGCEQVDTVEQLAIDRARQLFGAEHVNVQPHSGSQANTAVYFSVLQVGDRILTMDLAHGGHLTHGHQMNFSGKLFTVRHYGVSPQTETIDYDELQKAAAEFQPKMITVGASAYSRVIDFKRMGDIARSVGAYLFADIAHIAGLVAAGVHPSPVGHADFVTTTTHKTLRGPRGGLIMCRAPFAKAVDAAVFPGFQGGPLMHVIAAKAVCLGEALRPEFKQYQQQVARNAKALCEGMKKNGYRIVSGTTENHVMLVDVQPQGLTGKEVQETLDRAGITVNKNAIPFDKQSPFKAGGVRLGSPAVTTRGMQEDEMFDIANFIHEALCQRHDAKALAALQSKVRAFTMNYPLPG
ncbi:MAG: serine hydroxymethyltransferase [Verrucomicrobiales bacterium]|nr:serine hydroxymethyltransferase [Verrucomicrobiales bacterium]